MRTLIFSPHDDDGIIGCSAFLEGSTVIIVTDGSLGYTDLAQREEIVDIRREEAERAYSVYDAEVMRLDFPDMCLNPYECFTTPDGRAGLYYHFIRIIRQVRPELILIPNELDFHPDHKSTHRAALVGIRQASSSIIPDLGEPHSVVRVMQYEVWNQLAHRSEVREVDRGRKLMALSEFRSQSRILDEVPEIGGSEHFFQMS